MPREATKRLAAGRGRYVDDAPASAKEAQAAFLRSPIAHGTFTVTDTSAAAALPGVVAVLTAADIGTVCGGWTTSSQVFANMVSPEQKPLADGRVLYQGEPVAMVLAESRAIAEDALELIAIDWRELPPVTQLDSALNPGSVTVDAALADNLSWETDTRGGEGQAAFEAAALIVKQRFVFNRCTGVTLETRGVAADWDPTIEKLTVRISHQMPNQIQLHLAELLGLPMSQVHVATGDVGGGFGIKMHVYPDEIAVCAAARLLERPIRYVADRMEALSSDIHAREHIIEARMGVDAGGHILGFDIEDLQGLGAYSVFPRASIMEAFSALRAIGAPYQYAHYHAHLRCALQNKVPTGQFRAVGHPIGCAVTEHLVDLAARARNENPLDFRRRNLMRAEAMPCINPAGGRMADLSHHACLDRMIAMQDLPALEAEIAAMRAQGRVIGLGYACSVEYTAPSSEVYGRTGVPVSANDTVTAMLEPDGSIKAQASISEIGQGSTQSLTQIMADAVGVSTKQINLSTNDSAFVAHGGGAWASRCTSIGGEAAWGAGRKLREQALLAASALLQTTSDTLDIRNSRIVDAATGADRMGLGEVARIVTFRGYELPQGVLPQLSVSYQYRRENDANLPNNSIQASLVEIDPDIGTVSVLRHWAVVDCGRIVNPLLMGEQIRGGIVMGIGEALFEACRYDDDGQILTVSMADYLVPMASEMPDIKIDYVETPYPGSVIGAKGAGEAGTCGAPAATLNAVNDALAAFGATVSELPITPANVLRALGRCL